MRRKLKLSIRLATLWFSRSSTKLMQGGATSMKSDLGRDRMVGDRNAVDQDMMMGSEAKGTINGLLGDSWRT